jgi:hypothetical protein
MSFGQAARGAASFFPEDRKELGGKSYMIWVYGERSRTSRISHTLKSIICENSMVHCTFSQIILSVWYMALYGTEKHNHSRISRMVVSWPWPGSFNVPFHQVRQGSHDATIQQEQFWAPRLGWHAAVKVVMPSAGLTLRSWPEIWGSGWVLHGFGGDESYLDISSWRWLSLISHIS